MNLTINDGVATLDFGRPDQANSLDLEAWRELGEQFTELGTNDAVRVILLVGGGRHWCAGMDLSVLQGLAARAQPPGPETLARLKGFIKSIQASITAIAHCPKPVLAAIQGGCIGGGVAIASACDLRYCTEDAYFVVKEIDFGIVADIGTLQRLPRVMAPGIATELCYTGRAMTSSEAIQTGFANAKFTTTGDMLTGVGNLAALIATKDPDAIEGLKRQLAFSADHSIDEGLAAVAEYSARLMMSKLRGEG